MYSITADQNKVLLWLQTQFTPALTITQSEDDVQNQGIVEQVRYVTFSRDADHYTSNFDATVNVPYGPSITLVNLKEAIDHNTAPPWVPYPQPTPPAPPTPPASTIVDGPVTVDAEGRQFKVQTNLATGQKRTLKMCVVGWNVVTDWA